MSNITLASLGPDDIYNVMYICQDCTWISSQRFPHTKGYELVLKLAAFFESVDNVTVSGPQLAQLVGTSEERVAELFAFWGSADFFAQTIALAKDVVPLLGHPVQSSNVFIGLYVFLALLTTAVLFLRFYSRLTINGRIRSYDWILLAGAIITFGFGMMQAILIAGTSHYRGMWDRSWVSFVDDHGGTLASDILYPIVVFLIKTSLLIFYSTLTPWQPLRVGTAVTFVIVLANSLCMIFIWTFHCNPVIYWVGDHYFNSICKSDLWEKSELILGSINIFTDVIIWIIPLPMVWRVTHGVRERVYSIVMFGLGALACVACGVRLSTVRELFAGTVTPPDQSKYCIWTMVELYLAVICSSIPALRALLAKKAPSLLSSTKPSSNESQDSEKLGGLSLDKGNDFLTIAVSEKKNGSHTHPDF